MKNLTPATRAARIFRAALFVCAAALLPSAAGALPFWMHLPEQASTYAPEIDNMFHLIMWITGVIFVVVELMLVYFLWRYRHREGRKAHYTHGNNRLEVVWTILPGADLRDARPAVAADLGPDQGEHAARGTRDPRDRRAVRLEHPLPGTGRQVRHRRRHPHAQPAPLPGRQARHRDADVEGRHPLLLPARIPRQAGRGPRHAHEDLVRRQQGRATGRSRAPSCAASATSA